MKMDEEVDGQRDHTIVDIEDATHRLVTCMKRRLQSLSHISQESCIYKVPKSLRDINEEAYVPRLVSIGPYHHGNGGLKAMEEHKWRYFRSFIEQNGIDLDCLVRFVKRRESRAKKFYAEPILLSGDQFVQVILVDAIFVVNILLEFSTSHSSNPVRSIYHEISFLNWVYRDMLLLENQLPFFVLKEILYFARAATGSGISDDRSILNLTHSFFEFFVGQEGVADNINSSEVRHFIDFLRLCHLPAKHRQQPKHEGKLELQKSLTGLHEAGVRFKLASSKQLLDIQFKDGVLEIPGIFVHDLTETFFRNLLAYDQCHHGTSHISDYIALMESLIRTPQDVELLVKNGILRNSLANNQEVSKLFNNLAKEIGYSANSFYYSHLCEELDDYCKIPWHKWKATLKHNYLNTPWAVISILAASVLLVLTLDTNSVCCHLTVAFISISILAASFLFLLCSCCLFMSRTQFLSLYNPHCK